MNIGAREMEFGSLDGRDHEKHNGVSFVKISKIFMKQGAFFLWNRTIWWTILAQYEMYIYIFQHGKLQALDKVKLKNDKHTNLNAKDAHLGEISHEMYDTA